MVASGPHPRARCTLAIQRTPQGLCVISDYGRRVALNALTSKEKDGKVVVENPNRKLANLLFCKKGEPSELASKRMREIRKNLAAA